MKLSAHFKKVLWSGFRTTFRGIASLVKNRKETGEIESEDESSSRLANHKEINNFCENYKFSEKS